MKRISSIGWIVLLVLVVGAFFHKTFTNGYIPAPIDTLVGLYHPWRDVFAAQYPRGVPFKNFLITDPIRQQIPWRKIVMDSWKSGTIPSWNPYTFAGVPLNANIQAAPFYPLNILFLLFQFPAAWTALIIVQPLLASLFLFWYLRNQNVHPPGAFIGAVSWAFSGFAVSWMTWGTIMQTALWMPLLLLSIDHLISSVTRGAHIRWTAVFVLSIVMMGTAGHAQVMLYMCTVSGLYVLWRTRGKRKIALPGMRWMGIGAILALLLTAVQWMPLLRFLPQTGRVAGQSAWNVAGWFLPWQHLAQFIAPDFFGNPATLNYWGIWNYGEFIGYVGIIPLVFALSSVLSSGVPMFFSLTLLGALLFMLPNPVATAPFVLHVPVISVLQPTRLMAVVDLCLAILAAYGIDRAANNIRRTWWSFAVVGGITGVLWVIVFFGKHIWHDPATIANLLIAKHNMVLPTLLIAIAILWYGLWVRIKRGWVSHLMTAVLVLFVVADLFRFGWKFTPFTDAAYFFPSSYILTYLSHQPKPFRVMSLDDRILPPNTASYYGIESIEGYDPLAPKRYEQFLAASELGKADLSKPSGFNRIYTAHNIASRLLPYLNVRYVLALSDVSSPFLKKVMQDGGVRLYEYTKGLPRVYLAGQVEVRAKPEDILNALLSVSPSPVGIVEKPLSMLSVPISANEGVQLVSYAPNAYSIRSVTDNPRVVVILNSFDPGWHATIDGKQTDVFPVNYLFTGLVVPAGTHVIRATYL